MSGGNAVLAAIDAIAKNPVPPIVQTEIETIVVAWNQLRSLGVTEIQTAIINAVRDQVLKPINDQIIAFCSALCQGETAELTLLLGIDPAQCSQPLDAEKLLKLLLNISDALFDAA